MRCQKNIQMISKQIIFVCALHIGYGWKIKSDEVNKIEELKTKCTLLCPFQKQTPDLYVDDITCEIDCKIEHVLLDQMETSKYSRNKCVKGCHFLNTALETECETLCNVPHNAVNSSNLYCFIGCKQSLVMYFESIQSEISNIKAPSLVEHTLSSTSLTLEWDEPHLVNETHMLQCCQIDLSNEWQFCQNQMWTSSSVVSVQTLQPYTKYQFRVALRLTPGDWYEIFSEPSSIIATSPGGLPTSPPRILTATSVSSSIISVIWEEGEFTNGPVQSYILQINELPVGYAAVRDITATKKVHSYLLKNLQPSTKYSITISARNAIGLGPTADFIVKTKPFVGTANEKIELMVATEHSVYSITSGDQEEPVLMYNTTHSIKGIALHIPRELLFISDSSGSIIVTSSKGLLTPRELPITSPSKPSALTIDWLSDHLYILSDILHPSGSIVYQVARCGLNGSNFIVVISGFIMEPYHLEVDPYNGFLFWVVRGVGLYRLDLIDISKVINRNVSPELILDDPNLGAFLVNYDFFRILIQTQTDILSVSLDGEDTERFCVKHRESKQQNVISLTMAGGSLFSTNGEYIYQEDCDDTQNKSFIKNITNKLLKENYQVILANTAHSQPFPVPVNPPTNFQAIFGYEIAKVSWEKPYCLAGQGEGAWSAWSYRLIVEDQNGTLLFDYNDIKVNQYTVSSLRAGTEYILKVGAYTFSGEGPWSPEFRGKTLHRNTSLLWSSTDGLLKSDITGYRVTKIEPINYAETDFEFLISDIDWYEDQVFVSTNKRQVYWYNLTSYTYGRIQDINGADCISVDWLAGKLYWGNKRSKMIFRADFSGNQQENLPIVVATESLFLNSYSAFIYWSTKNTVEGACLDGTRRKIFYASKNAFRSQIVGLALDIDRSELYWLEKTSSHPRQSALMIINVKNDTRQQHVDKFSLINQDAGGGLCYIDQHLVWVRNDDKNAMISGLNGTTTAQVHSDSLSQLITCTAVDPFVRTLSPLQRNNTEKINVIPLSVVKSSVRVEGSFNLFNITWDPVTNVNYGKIYYRIRIKLEDQDQSIDTSNTFITIKFNKAYVSLKIVLQSYTYWSSSNPVRITLHSPPSTPSAPANPRVFVTHKKKSVFQQKEVSVIFRWSAPTEPNGIIQRYELSCWVTYNFTNSSRTSCSSTQISTKSLEFTLQNLPTNKIHNFQVRACNSIGCGNWSHVVRTNFDDEFPVPKLLVVTSEGLTKMDYDRKSMSISIPETKNVRDIFYEASQSVIFWIEKNSIFQSHLNLHLTNTKKLIDLKNEGLYLSYDWLGRKLFWLEVNRRKWSINMLDMNRNEEDHRVEMLVERRTVIRDIIAVPINSILIWIDSESEESVSGTLMRCYTDGTHVTEFFKKEMAFYKNDVSSIPSTVVEENEGACNCSSTKVGLSVSLYYDSTSQYRLLWFDVVSHFIMSADLEGCSCTRILDVRNVSKNAKPKSITADMRKVYWLDPDEITIYAAPIENRDIPIEKGSASSGTRIRTILSFDSQLQYFPDTRCLWPHLKQGKVQVTKYFSDSMTVRLPAIKKESICKNISLATMEYTIFYGIMNDNGTSECISNWRTCLQIITFDRVKKINKLKPYTRYVFIVGIGNYYSQLEGNEPVTGDPAIYRTAPGKPSPPRNVTAVPLSPNVVLVKWSPPESYNAESVGYFVQWLIKYANGTGDANKSHPWKRVNTSLLLENLQPSQNYTVWVNAYPIVNGKSMPSIGCGRSENITVQTYPRPSNLSLINASSSALNISLPKELSKFRFGVEIYNNDTKNWDSIRRDNSQYIIIDKLLPLTMHKVRLKVRYPLSQSPYLWLPDGFTLQTSGDKPGPPGVPIFTRVGEELCRVRWEPSTNYGYGALVYQLEGRHVDLNDKAAAADGYNWTMLYNGTENVWTSASLEYNAAYKFRVRASNEYGIGQYSPISDEYELRNEKYTKIALWWIVPTLGMSVVIGFILLIYVYQCRSTKKKHKFEKSETMASPVRHRDVELVNLQEIPATTNIKNNLLYIPQVEENQISAEFSQIPRIRREQISLAKFLGCGAFGEVYEGKVKNLLYVNIETKVAVKALRKNATEQEKEEFLKEALLMSNFKHKHILQLLGICIDNNPHFIIMELMEGGDLLSYLRSNRVTSTTTCGLSYSDLLDICCDVASGCCYLEELHFVHRDLACRNCLVSSRDPVHRIVKIGDFGLARDIYKNDYYRKKGEGLLPVRWMAPESLVDGVFTRHSDVWSFGVLLWEIMSLGQQPYQARSNVEVLQYVRSGGRLSCPSTCPPRLYKLMEKCWNFKPKERPTFAYCLSELEDLKDNYESHSSDINYTSCLEVSNSPDTSVS